jgi:hypothetical protein
MEATAAQIGDAIIFLADTNQAKICRILSGLRDRWASSSA